MRYQSQNVLSVLMKCLVTTDEIVVDLTRSTQIILRHPVRINILWIFASFVQNMQNELFKFYVDFDVYRPRNHKIYCTNSVILRHHTNDTVSKKVTLWISYNKNVQSEQI